MSAPKSFDDLIALFRDVKPQDKLPYAMQLAEERATATGVPLIATPPLSRLHLIAQALTEKDLVEDEPDIAAEWDTEGRLLFTEVHRLGW
jgi:hypothetical protein